MNGFKLLLLILIFGSGPRKEFRETCDVIELNNKMDHSGVVLYKQWIFWDWNSSLQKHIAIGFILEKNSVYFSKTENRYNLKWDSDVDGFLEVKTISAPVYKETWTNNDPEFECKQKHKNVNRRRMWQK